MRVPRIHRKSVVLASLPAAACCVATADRQILSTAALNASRQHDDRLPHSWLEANSWEHLAAEGPRDSMIKGCLLA